MLKLNDDSEVMYYAVSILVGKTTKFKSHYTHYDTASYMANSICRNLVVSKRDINTTIIIAKRSRSKRTVGGYAYRTAVMRRISVTAHTPPIRPQMLISKLPLSEEIYDLVEVKAFRHIPGMDGLAAKGCCFYSNSGLENNLYRTIDSAGYFDIGYSVIGEMDLYYSFNNPDSVLDTLKMIVHVHNGAIGSSGLRTASITALYRGEKTYRPAPLADIKSSFELEVR